jgi:hypothetical protein
MGEGLTMTNLIDTRPTGPAAPLPPPGPTRPPVHRTPVGVRVLWKVFAGVLVLAALVWGPYQVVTLLAHEERLETETFPAAGIARIEIDGASGSVDVVAEDRDTIEVQAAISDGLRRTGESRRVVGDTLRLHSTCPNFGSDFCWVDYQLRVPLDLELVVDTSNGSVRVNGSDAPLTIDADNGSIRLANVSGPLQLSTDNGRVEGLQLRSPNANADSDNGRVQLEFVVAPSTVLATSNNGSVEVVVPADGTAYRVDAATDNGREVVDVPTDPASERSITVRTDHGSVTARTS